ncbi:uncharacterized protein METZ01_LOCUS417538 [marine metagenome]|uniref:Uncharacterized protein n=1 Tax=marine metagenome TaxID=408172 RepID=A0A382X1D8_9ZZZZ
MRIPLMMHLIQGHLYFRGGDSEMPQAHQN